jgi:hypothetical protein
VPALLVVMIWLGFAVLALLPVPARHTEPAEASQHAKERLAPGSNNIAA